MAGKTGLATAPRPGRSAKRRFSRSCPSRPSERRRPRRADVTLAPAPPAVTTVCAAPPAPPSLPQVDALRRQQQRILHRSALVDYVLAAERQRGQTLTPGEALAELLADITEAARTIGTLLQTTTGRP